MELPQKVKDRLMELNKKSRHSVQIRLVKGRYYVYECSNMYDKGRSKWKSVALYLGKMDADGKFTKARYRVSSRSDASSLDELMLKRGRHNDTGNLESLIYPDEIDRKILEKISTDGRATISEISKYANVSRSKAQRRLHRLESLYKIKYTLDFAPRPFGLFRFYILVKFRNGVPDVEKIKEVLNRYPLIQTVALLKGEYDIFIYLLANNTAYLEDVVYEIRQNKVFSDQDADWIVSYITSSYGFIPFRDRFFDIIKDKIWHKTKELPRKPVNMLLEREFNVLYELNKHGRIDFNEIDKKYQMHSGAAHYTYHKLLEKKIIRRITITMDSLPLKYTALLISNQANISEFDKGKANYRRYLIENTTYLTNRFILLGDIGAPYGMFSILPVFESSDLQKTENSFRSFFGNGVELHTMIIIQLLIGKLGFRRLDNKESTQYKILHGIKQEAIDFYIPNNQEPK